MSKNQRNNFKSLRYCGVPQCYNKQSDELSMHRLPKHVKDSPVLLKEWACILRMGKKFPNNFRICSDHFEPNQILTALISRKKVLVKGVYPSLKLPVLSIQNTIKVDATRKKPLDVRNAKKLTTDNNDLIEYTDMLPANTELTKPTEYASIGIQSTAVTAEKAMQAVICMLFDVTSLWDNDSKLFTMTGIPNMKLLDVMVGMCKTIRPNDHYAMNFKTRILLTMHKLKSNCSFTELAISFQITDATAKRYFADIVQLLAVGMKKLIHWQSREQNRQNLPKCFRAYPNVRTILDCTEFKTVTSQCLSCRTCTYSHYKGAHTLKVLIGVSPSGAINYLSKVATGKSSDKAMFNLCELLLKLEPGDAVMVDKGFLIADELANAGIELVRPDFLFEKFTKEQVERSTKIASARVHVERRIARLKQMKILSERICSSMTPYMDEIMIVLSALSNLGTPILQDNKF